MTPECREFQEIVVAFCFIILLFVVLCVGAARLTEEFWLPKEVIIENNPGENDGIQPIRSTSAGDKRESD
jgi:hypothetical protein